MNAATIGKVIGDLQALRDSARNRAVLAYDAEDLRAFEYWPKPSTDWRRPNPSSRSET